MEELKIFLDLLKLQESNAVAFFSIAGTLLTIVIYRLFGKQIYKKIQNVLSLRSKKKKIKTLNQLISIDAYILDKLTKRLEQLDCDRILVFQYHKRRHDEIVRMTCTHEIVRKTQKNETHSTVCKLNHYVQGKYNNLPATIQPFFLLRSLDRNVHVVEDINDIKQEFFQLHKELSSRNLKGFILAPLLDNTDPVSKNNLLGFILFEYCFKKPAPTAEELEKIKTIASRISVLLKTPESYYEDYINEVLDLHRQTKAL